MIRCPQCKATRLTYCEDVTQYREVLGRRADGRVVVSGEISTETEGSDERWQCEACGHEWPIRQRIAFDEPVTHAIDCDLDEDCTCEGARHEQR